MKKYIFSFSLLILLFSVVSCTQNIKLPSSTGNLSIALPKIAKTTVDITNIVRYSIIISNDKTKFEKEGQAGSKIEFSDIPFGTYNVSGIGYNSNNTRLSFASAQVSITSDTITTIDLQFETTPAMALWNTDGFNQEANSDSAYNLKVSIIDTTATSISNIQINCFCSKHMEFDDNNNFYTCIADTTNTNTSSFSLVKYLAPNYTETEVIETEVIETIYDAPLSNLKYIGNGKLLYSFCTGGVLSVYDTNTSKITTFNNFESSLYELIFIPKNDNEILCYVRTSMPAETSSVPYSYSSYLLNIQTNTITESSPLNIKLPESTKTDLQPQINNPYIYKDYLYFIISTGGSSLYNYGNGLIRYEIKDGIPSSSYDTSFGTAGILGNKGSTLSKDNNTIFKPDTANSGFYYPVKIVASRGNYLYIADDGYDLVNNMLVEVNRIVKVDISNNSLSSYTVSGINFSSSFASTENAAEYINSLEAGSITVQCIPLQGNLDSTTLSQIGSAIKKKSEINFTLDLSSVTGLTEIAANTFMNCINLQHITLPNTIKIIGDSAFYGCTNLAYLELSFLENLKTIGASAFRGCSIISIMNFPESLTSIGANAFSECTNLLNITIPTSSWTVTDDTTTTTVTITVDEYGTNATVDGTTESITSLLTGTYAAYEWTK